ncbi:hypothetical protein AB0G05_09895 [Nonomuraea wenchangensis]
MCAWRTPQEQPCVALSSFSPPRSPPCPPSCPPPANGRYAINRLADPRGGRAPWPPFAEVDLAALARSLGCPAHKVDGHAELVAALEEVVPTLAAREEPLLLDVNVTVGPDVQP